jgi:hypothetical protein
MRALGRTALLASLTFVAWSPAAAQTTTGSIRGFVRNASGAPISDVQLVARNVTMGVTRGTATTATGFYNIAGLRPGQYELTARRIGLTPQTRTIQVLIGQTHSSDFVLSEAAVTLQAVVTAATAVGTTEVKTSEVGMNVTREQIENLPTFDRNFLEFAKLSPGIMATRVNDENKVLRAGGQPAEAVNVFVDGATYKNDVLKGGVAGQDASKGNPFPQGAVQEFRIVTQNYKAEYQKAASAIITATTRSGSNEWEADVFAFGVGRGWVAKDALAVRRRLGAPDYKRLQAGGSLGGPIQRDKLFIFGTYELNFRDQPQFVSLGGSAPSAPPGVNFAQYVGEFTSEFREHLGFAKLTYLPGSRHTIDASVNIRHETDFRGFGGQTSFESAENVKVDVNTAVANWKYAGDRWLNEAQLNFQNFVWNPEPLNEQTVGRNYIGILRFGGRDTRQEFTQNRLSLRNDVTRSGVQFAGDHVFKGGANVDFLSYKAVKHFNANPVFEFRSAENWSRPFQAFFGFGDPDVSTDNTQFGFYVQDDWTPTPRLVLNLGVRWDAETNMINNWYVTPQPLRDSLIALRGQGQFVVNQPVLRADGTCCDQVPVNVIDQLGGLENFLTSGSSDRPMYLGAWQPRFGASYDLFGNSGTVLFAGVGIYYDRNYWNTLLDEQFRRQFKVLRLEFNDVGPTAGCPRCVQWDPRYFDPDELRALAQSGQAGLPEVFLVANDLKPPKSLQTSVGVRHQLGPALFTLSYNGVRGSQGMNYIRATRPNSLGPNYNQAFITDCRVKTWYDAMQFQVERQMRGSSRWGGSLAYTLARAQEQGQSWDLFWGFDDRYPTVADRPRRRVPENQVHTVVANGMVRLPYDVLFSTVVSLGSGLTLNGVDASQGDDPYRRRSYIFDPPTRPFLGIGHVFNTQSADIRFEKEFTVASGQSASVVADVFNVFNSELFGCYETRINPLTGPPNANFGQPTCAGLGRRLQLGLRYGLRPISRGSLRQ